MKNIDIITSHNVTIEYQLASVMDRFLALLIDAAILTAYGFIVFVIAVNSGSSDQFEVIFGILFTPVSLFYHLFCEMFSGGQSVGKRLMGIKVVRLNGQNPNLGECFLRWIFRLVDITATLGALAALFASANEKGQRLGDMIARTVVIKINPGTRYSINDILSIRDSSVHGETKYPQVTRLTDEDMLLIKNSIERVKMYPNEHHRRLIDEITVKVTETLGISEVPRDKVAFLRTLLQDYIVLTR